MPFRTSGSSVQPWSWTDLPEVSVGHFRQVQFRKKRLLIIQKWTGLGQTVTTPEWSPSAAGRDTFFKKFRFDLKAPYKVKIRKIVSPPAADDDTFFQKFRFDLKTPYKLKIRKIASPPAAGSDMLFKRKPNSACWEQLRTWKLEKMWTHMLQVILFS